jgi:hypothetical protein
MDEGGELPPIAIAPGSILAVAVTKSCKGVQSPIAQANNVSLSDADQIALDSAEKAAEAMHEATPGPEKEALLACAGVRPTKEYPIPSKSTCIKYLKTFNLDSSYYHPIATD